MFQTERMILESAVEIRQGRVARITRFREQAQVREHQLPGQPGAFVAFGVCRLLPKMSQEQHQDEYSAGKCRKDKELVGFAHDVDTLVDYSNESSKAGVIPFRRTILLPR